MLRISTGASSHATAMFGESEQVPRATPVASYAASQNPDEATTVTVTLTTVENSTASSKYSVFERSGYRFT
ncbi:hypothetical protein [Nitrobacter winogradskyi]|uniref:hypothetical protein n=1 Tax=Nitrobacter winogradskyi TaxID=913 RepID=UPI0015E84030|nr:hypothetical protein [Nitrobacter winogradskyi]